MTNTPKVPETKSVTKQFLESHFDGNGFEGMLDSLTPREVDYGPTPEQLGYAKGCVTFVYLYSDANGVDIALVNVYRAPGVPHCGGRKYHPQALLIDGVWCHT